MANFSLEPVEAAPAGPQTNAAPMADTTATAAPAPVEGSNFTLTPADAPLLGAVAQTVSGKGRITTDSAPRSAPPAPVKLDGRIPFTHQAILAAMDNPEERKAFLEKEYGTGAVSQDKHGLIVTDKDGKKLRATSGFFANMAADAPETVLGIAGAAEGAGAGMLAGPAGAFVGAVGGAMAGAAAGKTLKEGVKAATGTYNKTPGQYAKGIAGAAEGGAMGEIGGRAVGPVLSRLTRGPLPGLVTGATKETEAMTERTLAGGARPPPQSTMPDAMKLQRIAIIADKLSGPSHAIDRANKGYLQDSANRILTQAGVAGGGRSEIIKSMSQPTAALSTQETGQLIQSSARAQLSAYDAMLAKNVGAKPTAQTEKMAAYLRQMAATVKTPEAAYNYLVHGGQTDKLEKFVRIMGKDSAVVQSVQQQALRHTFAGAMDEVSENAGATGLSKWMNQFTEKQQDLLYPNGLKDDLRMLDKEIKFLYPGAKDPSVAGFTTGAMMQKKFYERWWHQGVGALYRGVLQQPAVIRRLAVGFRGNSAQRAAAKAGLKELFYFGAIEASEPSQPEQQVK